ncbi:hypothetical protein Aduo_016280 [Ancylostoma duodenale]
MGVAVTDTRPPIKYVLDVTIAYPNGIPLSLVSLGFGTREKCDIAVNYKIYNADEVPFDTEEKLRDWMYSVYKEKDEMLGKLFLNKMLISNKAGTTFVITKLFMANSSNEQE